MMSPRINSELRNLKGLVVRYKFDFILLSAVLLTCLIVFRVGLLEEIRALGTIREQVENYRALLEKERVKLQGLQQELKKLNGRTGKGSRVAIPYKNPYELAASVQKELKGLGVSDLSSIRLGRVEKWEGYKVATVSLSFTTDIAGLYGALKALEGKPYLRLTRLSVIRIVRRGREGVTVRIILQGLLTGD